MLLCSAVVFSLLVSSTPDNPKREAALAIEDLAIEDLLAGTISTATKSEQTVEEAPAISTVITRGQIERMGARQLSDVLQYVPGFYEVSGQLGRNFALRGVHSFSMQHCVVLIDGMEINDFLFSAAVPDAISLDYAEQVEIIRGPGSAIYGASALMCVINIVTRSGQNQDAAMERFSLGTNGYLRNTLRFGTAAGENDEFFVSTTFYRNDGTHHNVQPQRDILLPAIGQNISDGIQAGEALTVPRAGAGVEVDRFGPSFELFAKYRPSADTSFAAGYALTHLYLQRGLQQSLLDTKHEDVPPSYLKQRAFASFEKLWGRREGWGELKLRPSVVAHLHDFQAQRVSRDFYNRLGRQPQLIALEWSGTDVRLSASLEYAKELPDISVFESTNILGGLHVEQNMAAGYSMRQCFLDHEGDFDPSLIEANSDAGGDLYCVENIFLDEGVMTDVYGNVTYGDSPRFGDGDDFRFGAFAQLDSKIGRLRLVAGARFDHHDFYGTRLSPRIASVLPLAAGLYTKAQAASAFVYPAILYRTGNSLSPYVGNADIDSQSINVLEFLLGWRSEVARLEVSAYYNQVRDFITYDVGRLNKSGRYRFDNQGNLDIFGVENSAILTLWDNRLVLRLNGTYTVPVGDTTEGFLIEDDILGGATKYPRWLGAGTVNVTPIGWLNLNVRGRYASAVEPQFAPEAVFERIEGTDGQIYSSATGATYTTQAYFLDATIQATWRDWQLALVGHNLLDAKRSRAGAVVVPLLLPGRQLIASVSYQY